VGRFLAQWFGKLVTRNVVAPTYAKTPIVVTSVQVLKEKADVCCIYVEDGHWFSLANGAVVHNSHGADAWRGFAVVAKPPKPPQAVQPQRRDLVSAWS